MSTQLRNPTLDALLARTVMLLRDAGNFDPSDEEIHDAMGGATVDLILDLVALGASNVYASIGRLPETFEFIRGVLEIKRIEYEQKTDDDTP